MKKFYLIFAAAVIAVLLLGCPSTTQNNIETEVTDNGTGGNNGGQGQGSDNKALVITARITAMPKVTYIEGETFDLTGIRVTVYSDGKAAADLTNDAVFRYDAPDMSNIGTTDVEISFDYSGETLTVTLTITIGEDKIHGYTVEILDETKTRLPRGGKPFSADGVYYQLYDPTGNTDFGYGFLTKTVSDTDTSKLGKQTVTVTFSFRPHALNEEVVLTTSLEIEVIEFGIFTAADIAEDKIQWGDLKDEIQRYKQDMTNRPYDYTPMDWSKAFLDNTTDWSKVKDVTIDLADVDTVDVIGATVLKRYIDAKLEEAGKTKEDIENIVRFTDYTTDAKLNLDFNKLGEKGLSNTDFMGAIFGNKFDFDEQKGNSEVFTDLGYDIAYGKAGLADRTDDLIPGVQLVTFPNEYNYPGYRLNSFSQAFKFTSPAVVTMPKNTTTTYDLTGTYKGGILGDVTIDGLEDATMSGEIYKHDIKGIYNTFVKDKTDLPTLDIKFLGRSSDVNDNEELMNGALSKHGELNIYGTKIDELIETYYQNGQAGKFTFENSFGSGLSFDGSECVLANGGSMYENQGNGYIENRAYKLGVNAALVMAQSGMNISDVNVVDPSYDAVDSRDPIFGAGDDAGTQRYVNVRFEADMSRFSFSSNTSSAGIIDIAGPAPQNLPDAVNSAVIIRKDAVADGINYTDGAYEYDLGDLSNDELSRVSVGGGRIRTNENKAEFDANNPSIQQIETGAREGITDPRDIVVSNNHASVSPKKMKEKKDANLMRAILNGKDKEYS